MSKLKLSIVKNMRVKMLVPALLTALFAVPAIANDQYSDTGRVLSVTPQTERVNVPRQECRTEYQQQSYSNAGSRSITGAVIGGIAGGLLGNTVGKGNGRIAAAAVGAGVGAIVGDRIGNNQYDNGVATRSIPVQSCYQVDNWQTVNSGYLVTYAYNGRTYSTVTNNHPGDYIDVNVSVSPSVRTVSKVSYIEPIRYNKSGFNNGRGHDGHGKHRGWDKHHEDEGRRAYNGERRYY